MARLMIYGATGYTGRLVSEQAKRLGLDFVLAGRSEEKLQVLSTRLEMPHVQFGVNDNDIGTRLKEQNTTVLLNCAGPFVHTAAVLIDACLQNGVHYLDTAAELDSYRFAQEKSEEARESNVLLLPGCGGAAAVLDCLAGQLVDQVRQGGHTVVRLDVALHVSGPVTRGTALSAASMATTMPTLHCVHGQLVPRAEPAQKDFDFHDGRGAVPCVAMTLANVITIPDSTGVQNVGTFANATGDGFPSPDQIADMAEGPTEAERSENPYHASVAGRADDGTVHRAALATINGYALTPLLTAHAAKRVLDGTVEPGFQTAAGLFGHAFCMDVLGSKGHAF